MTRRMKRGEMTISPRYKYVFVGTVYIHLSASCIAPSAAQH
jgi:hypothetical protein